MLSSLWESTVRLIGWLFSRSVAHYRPIASVLVLLASTYYGLAFARFYGVLDTSPEAVGISAPQMLARSALGGALFVGVWTIYIFALFAPAIPRLSAIVGPGQEGRGGWGFEGFLGVVAVSVAGGLLWFFTLKAADAPLDSRLIFAGAPVVLAFLGSLRCQLHRPWVVVRALRFRFADFGAAAVLAAAVGLIPITSTTMRYAREAGESARAGEAVAPIEVLGVSMLGIRSDPALLQWAGDKGSKIELPACVSYLGRSGNTLVVYDPEQHRTMQLAAEDAILTTQSERTSCNAPVNYSRPTIRRHRRTLECSHGRWGPNRHPRYSFSWTEDGYEIETRVEDRFPLYLSDRGFEIQCGVVATDVHGSNDAYSDPFVFRSSTLRSRDGKSVGRPTG